MSEPREPLIRRRRRNVNDDDDERKRRRGTPVGLWFFAGLAAIAAAVFLGLWLGEVPIRSTTKDCGGIQIPNSALCADWVVAGVGNTGSRIVQVLSDDFTQHVIGIEQGPDNFNDPTTPFNTGDPSLSGVYLQAAPYQYNIIGEITNIETLGYRASRTYMGSGLGGTPLINGQLSVIGTSDWWDSFDVRAGNPGTFTGDAAYATNEQMEYLDTNGHYAVGPNRGNGALPSQTYKIASKPVVPDNDAVFCANLMSSAFGVVNAFNFSYNDKSAVNLCTYWQELIQDFNSSYYRWGPRPAFLDATVMNQATFTGQAGRQLDILLNSTVTQLLWDPNDPLHCIGVRYTDTLGNSRDVFARKKVIVSMNWLSSSLLQRSGVGPAQELANAKITPRLINENVGQNWAQHQFFAVLFYSSNITGGTSESPVTSYIGGTITFSEDSSAAGIPGRRGFQTIGITFPEIILFFPNQLVPKSTGWIDVYNGNPQNFPNMNPNPFSDADDLLSVRTYFRELVSGITATDPSVINLSIPDATLADDALLNQWIYDNNGFTNYHNYATNSMCISDATGVVDNRFNVFGLRGLGICDTSVFPFATDGNPSTPASILGDMCGRIFLEDAGSTSSRKPIVRKRKGPVPPPPKKRRRSEGKTFTAKNFERPPRDAPTQQQICTAVLNFIATAKAKLGSAAYDIVVAQLRANEPTCFT